jgi:serine/threonine-protein kinase
MEYASGGDLHRWAAAFDGFVPVERVVNVLRQVGAGLAFAHAQGIVHRDLKPANVLVDGETFKIADLGIGAVLDPAEGSLLTGEHLLSGASAIYADPRRYLADPRPTEDVYSLGKIGAALLLGDLDHDPASPDLYEQFLEAGAPEALAALLCSAIASRPERRPPDAMAFMERLDAVSGPASTAAKPGRRAQSEEWREWLSAASTAAQTWRERLSRLRPPGGRGARRRRTRTGSRRPPPGRRMHAAGRDTRRWRRARKWLLAPRKGRRDDRHPSPPGRPSLRPRRQRAVPGPCSRGSGGVVSSASTVGRAGPSTGSAGSPAWPSPPGSSLRAMVPDPPRSSGLRSFQRLSGDSTTSTGAGGGCCSSLVRTEC